MTNTHYEGLSVRHYYAQGTKLNIYTTFLVFISRSLISVYSKGNKGSFMTLDNGQAYIDRTRLNVQCVKGYSCRQ